MFDMLKTILLDIFGANEHRQPAPVGTNVVVDEDPSLGAITHGTLRHTVYDTDGSLYGCGPGFSLDV